MKANLKVTAGSVRIFNEQPQIDTRDTERLPTPVSAPYETELEGSWGVGSGGGSGEFIITPVKDGTLRVFSDGTASTNVEVNEGDQYTYDTIESNAVTVTTGW